MSYDIVSYDAYKFRHIALPAYDNNTSVKE